jgi:formylglycine-generating enzyme required for sulfatase activity
LSPGEAKEQKPQRITNRIGMRFVRIPSGEFMMGSPKSEAGRDDKDEGPRHLVMITKPYYLGVYEVTQNQFDRVVDYNPSCFTKGGKGKVGIKYELSPGAGKEKVRGVDTSDFPVENVTFAEAVLFCNKLTDRPSEKQEKRVHRLPTEAEWEYACRGGASSSAPFNINGKPSNSLSSSQANFHGSWPAGSGTAGPYLARTSKVGSYRPNGFGLYDMHGNVSEWCSDWYGQDYYSKSPQRDPEGPLTGSLRVMRGGNLFNLAWNCRSAYRSNGSPSEPYSYVGFRVVLEASDK